MSQLVNADDTSVIEIKTATDTSLKAKRNYIFARLCNEKQPFLYYTNLFGPRAGFAVSPPI